MRVALLSLAAFVVPGLCEPAVLRLGLTRNRAADPVGRDHRRFKRDTVDVDIFGYGMSGDIYSANITVGTPPQHVDVYIDTGSSDLWVVERDNPICRHPGARCGSLGTYDIVKSVTAEALSAPFEIVYGDESWAEGYYAVDALTIESVELPQVPFGVATRSGRDRGILGLGYSLNVASYYQYTNFPELLVLNNITNSNAYSLWLNRLGEDEGNILFGGVNTAHYTGELQTLPVIPYGGNYVHFWVALTSMGVASASDNISRTYNSRDFPTVVLLDSGASISYLPADIVRQIYSDLDVHFYEPEQFGYVPCTYIQGREDYNLRFTFSSLTIDVPLRELVLQNAMYYTDGYLDINGEESCMFGIAPNVDFFPILGDTFLRSAYVVFDLDNNEVSMAQANYNPGEDHILEIGTGRDAVPQATPVQNPVTRAKVEISGTSLHLTSGYTNEPIFPTTTRTAFDEALAETEATDAEASGLASALAVDPSLLVVGAAMGLLLRL